jgi:hypothetical protein
MRGGSNAGNRMGGRWNRDHCVFGALRHLYHTDCYRVWAVSYPGVHAPRGYLISRRSYFPI